MKREHNVPKAKDEGSVSKTREQSALSSGANGSSWMRTENSPWIWQVFMSSTSQGNYEAKAWAESEGRGGAIGGLRIGIKSSGRG